MVFEDVHCLYHLASVHLRMLANSVASRDEAPVAGSLEPACRSAHVCCRDTYAFRDSHYGGAWSFVEHSHAIGLAR